MRRFSGCRPGRRLLLRSAPLARRALAALLMTMASAVAHADRKANGFLAVEAEQLLRRRDIAFAHRRHNRRDAVPGDRVETVEVTEGLDEIGGNAGLFMRFAQGGCDRIAVARFDRAAGKTDLSGVLAGTLLLSSIRTAINVMGMPPHYTQMIHGGLVLVAVLLDAFKTTIRKRYL